MSAATGGRFGELSLPEGTTLNIYDTNGGIQPEENDDDNRVFLLEIMKDSFVPESKSVKPRYRVGNRLLAADEWIAYTKMNKGQRE